VTTSDSVQQTLFADPLGLRLRNAREGRRWSREAVAQQLKLPVAVIEAIEKEDWARLGPQVYARSYLTSYVRLLGLPPALVDEAVRPVSTAPLVAMGGVPASRRMVDRSLLNLGYLAITAAIVGSVVMLAMHFQAPARDAQVLTLETPTPAAPRPASASPAPVPADRSPVMASMAPALPAAVAAPATPPVAAVAGEIVLRFRGESWVEVLGPNGDIVERGLVPAGSERRLLPGTVGQVKFGNADAVDVLQAGRVVDVTAFRQANIARFAVSSEGSLTPPGG
jgi:cytoskeleton protein RodZ